MNERIQELAEQVYGSQATEQEITFAELIIQQCAQICQDQPNHYALKTDRDNCAVAIKEHFGVDSA
jgi:hypothetical protein